MSTNYSPRVAGARILGHGPSGVVVYLVDELDRVLAIWAAEKPDDLEHWLAQMVARFVAS